MCLFQETGRDAGQISIHVHITPFFHKKPALRDFSQRAVITPLKPSVQRGITVFWKPAWIRIRTKANTIKLALHVTANHDTVHSLFNSLLCTTFEHVSDTTGTNANGWKYYATLPPITKSHKQPHISYHYYLRQLLHLTWLKPHKHVFPLLQAAGHITLSGLLTGSSDMNVPRIQTQETDNGEKWRTVRIM
jgi:hypothetical protein